MTWLFKAVEQEELALTYNNCCPECKKVHQTRLNACPKHKWVSRRWFMRKYPNRYDRYKELID